MATAQRGTSLLIVLVFMLVLSLLAAFGVRNVTLLEKQARNEQEYQLARQAAEAALRDAETDLRIPEPEGLYTLTGATCGRENSNFRINGVAAAQSAEFTDDCLLGQCGADPARYNVAWASASTSNKGAPWWPANKGGNWGNNATTTGAPSFNCTTAKGGVPLGTYTGATKFTRVARQPEYLIEFIQAPKAISGAVVESTFECTGQFAAGSATVKSAKNETTGATVPAKGACHVFRITARGFGLATTNDSGIPVPRVEVVLQSYFQVFVK